MLIKDIFTEIKNIQKLSHDAQKPIDEKLAKNEIAKQKFIERQEGYKKQALERAEQLKEKIQQAQSEAVVWLYSILDQTTLPETPPEITATTRRIYGEYFNEEIFRQLLPYTQLAYAYEQNGSAEEHALKLAVLFKDFNSALDYIYNNKSVHDACLFTLPDPNACTFPIWQDLAKKNGKEEDFFRKLLGQACEIEDLINGDVQKEGEKEEKSKVDWNRINDLKKTIETKQARWKKLNTNEIERERNSAEYDSLSKDLLDHRTELTQLRAGLPLDNQIDLLTLWCYQERYIQETSGSYKYMLSHGLTKKDYGKFIQLDRTNAGANIPDVQMDGKDLGYPGYYFKKINVQDETEAARAACLGKLTDCCQSVSGETGEPCAMHGLTSPNGGFYILCQGDLANPKISDPVIAQSWVWRSTTNALVFDSIESSSKDQATNNMAIEFYRHIGKKLCVNNETPKVHCGARSGISSMASNVNTDSEIHVDYYGYSDSLKQMCIYDTDKPWYFFNQDEDATKMTESILVSVLTGQKPLIESISFCEMLNWAMINNNQLFDYIKSKSKEYEVHKDEFDSIIDNMMYFICATVDLDKIWDYLEKNTFYINTQNNLGQTFLYEIAKQQQPHLFERLIKKGANVHTRDLEGKTILHHLVNQPEYIQLCLESIPEQDRLSAVRIKDHKGVTPIHLAGNIDKSLPTMLALLPENDRITAVLTRDKKGITPMHATMGNFELLKAILALLPEKDRLKAVQIKDEDGNTLLHTASNLEVVELILDLYPKKSQLAAIQVRNNNKETVLHCITKHPKILKTIFNMFPKDQLELIQAKDSDDKTPLHHAASQAESILIIKALYSEKDWLEVINTKTKSGKTLLHFTATHPESLELMLGFYEDNLLDTIKMAFDFTKENLMHLAISNPKSIEVILTRIPKNEILKMVTMPDYLGVHVLRRAVNNSFPTFKLILEHLPPEQRINAINSLNDYSLRQLTANVENFIEIFNLIPQDQRLNMLKIADDSKTLLRNKTLLQLITKTPEGIKAIFHNLPEELKFEILEIKSHEFGEKLLYSVETVDCTIAILESFPQSKWFDVLKIGDSGHNTILEKNFETLQAILERLPSDQKIEALMMPTRSDKPLLLQYGIKQTLELLPKDKLMDVLLMEVGEGDGPIIHQFSRDPTSLSAIISPLSEEQQLKLLRTAKEYQSRRGNGWSTVMFGLVSELAGDNYVQSENISIEEHLKPIKGLLESLTEKSRIELIKSIASNNGGNLLHYTAANKLELFKLLLNYLPDDEKFNALEAKTNKGSTVLHFAAQNADSVKTILELYSTKEEKLKAVMVAVESGKTVLDYTLGAGSEESYYILQPLLSEDKRKEVEAELLKESPLFCIKVDNLDHFIKLFEKLDGKNRMKITTINDYIKNALSDNALKIINWLTDEHVLLDNDVFKARFNQFCVTNAANYDNEAFKSILEKCIDYSFNTGKWNYLNGALVNNPHLNNQPEFEGRCDGIKILLKCYQKVAKRVEKNNETNSQTDNEQLEKALHSIRSQIKGYIAGNKDSDSFIKNAAEAKDRLKSLIKDKSKNMDEIASGLEQILFKDQGSPLVSQGMFAKSEENPSQEDVTTEEKEDDENMEEPSNCTIF